MVVLTTIRSHKSVTIVDLATMCCNILHSKKGKQWVYTHIKWGTQKYCWIHCIYYSLNMFNDTFPGLPR